MVLMYQPLKPLDPLTLKPLNPQTLKRHNNKNISIISKHNMKRLFKLTLIAAMLFCCHSAQAVYVQNMPVIQFQPNGDTVHMFATGDECYHRFHDSNNYTIVQAPSGWWVYAEADNEKGLKPSSHRAGTVNPATLGITPGLTISRQEWHKRRQAWVIPEQYRIATPKTSGRNHGDFCNLVIFIRFADDTVYTRPFSNVDHMFSDSSRESTVSVYNYFKHASYNKLFVRTYYAPEPQGDQIISYKDVHPRNYYMPYTQANPIGYTNYRDRTEREFDLFVSAVNYINDSAPIPSAYNLDCDGDGFIDNVNFVVKGAAAGWNDLLWPHKWNLYGHDVFINGKQVSTFNLALEGSGESYFGASTFCHEMFHSLGAPDLYRYNSGDDISPVGPWDLMATNSRPPQHMSAYMKYKYGNWLDSIPLITTPGTYTLNSVADSTPENIAYRFPSADPDQFYVVEYRDKSETFEGQLPGKGLLIYRVDTRFNGNAGYNGYDNFDEIWIFRPGSNSSEEAGQLSEAYFAPNRRRTEFSPSTSYYPYLSDGTPDFTFSITNVSTPGNTISFHYSNHAKPAYLETERVTTTTATLSWRGNANAYKIYYRQVGSNSPFLQRIVYSPHATITGLEKNSYYEWTVRGYFDPQGDSYADSTQLPNTATFHTEICNNSSTALVDYFSTEQRTGMPFVSSEKYNYSQQIFLAEELDGPKHINSISLHYAYSQPITKNNCTIYLANTNQSQFSDTFAMMPLEQLTQVFCGNLTFHQGWNEIALDSAFIYNGTDNLLVAIDDNSGTATYAGDKFYIHNTSSVQAIVYHSSTYNPDPADADSIQGTRQGQWFRNNIKFNGCPFNSGNYYVCIISDNEDFGTVSGEGYYSHNEDISIHAYPKTGYRFKMWHDGNTDNPRNVLVTSDTVFVAYFTSPLGIEPTDEQGGYVILSQHQRITVQGADNQAVVVYDLLGRRIASADRHHAASVSFQLPGRGVYIVRIGNEKPVKLFVQ